MNNDRGKAEYVENYTKRQEVYGRLQGLEQERRRVHTPEELEAFERELRGYTDQLGALLLELHLQASLDCEEHQKKEEELIRSWPGRLKSDGYERVRIVTLGGVGITVWARYYCRGCDRRSGKRYKGVYGGLVLLGVHEHCTPALAATVSAWSALLSSFAEVRQVLLEQGVKLDVKGVRRVAYRYAERARVLQQAGHIAVAEGDTVQGRRVVVSADGGRLRLRENKRGAKTKKGRTRYRGAWREPKLLIIYVVDARGKLEKSFAPLIDGHLQGPEALFHLLEGYLHSLAIDRADHVLFVADGAHWLWNRIPRLIATLGLEPQRVHLLIDFYHATEHLGKLAALRKNWSARQRHAWIRTQRRRLWRGHIAEVVEAIQVFCRGRNSKAIRTERDYFVRNRQRMAYQTVRALKLPIGSGAIESAIRRVVNLRLKGACIFWGKGNAEKILMLRAFYKAGRWSLLKQMANSPLSLVTA
jgi:hypothetical protein